MFQKPADKDERRARAAVVRTWVRDVASLPDSATVMVQELACTEPGCAPVETVIAVLRGPGDNRQVKVFKPLADVTKEDVCAALQDPGDNK